MVSLRGHHLLCLLGFRGLGYSQEFVDGLSRIALHLRSFPQTRIQVIDQPDDICSACPFLGEEGCQEKGPQSEEIARGRDEAVMRRLDLKVGEELDWVEAKGRVRSTMSPADLDEICQDCQWLPYGYCKEGLERLIKGEGGGGFSLDSARA